MFVDIVVVIVVVAVFLLGYKQSGPVLNGVLWRRNTTREPFLPKQGRIDNHPASHVTLWVSRGKFASRTSFQGGIFYCSGGLLFFFRGAFFYDMQNGRYHSGGHWPP